MRTLSLILIALFFPLQTFSQQNALDNWNYRVDYTNYFRAFMTDDEKAVLEQEKQYFWAYLHTDPDVTLANWRMGELYDLRNPDSAIYYFERTLKLFTQDEYKKHRKTYYSGDMIRVVDSRGRTRLKNATYEDIRLNILRRLNENKKQKLHYRDSDLWSYAFTLGPQAVLSLDQNIWATFRLLNHSENPVESIKLSWDESYEGISAGVSNFSEQSYHGKGDVVVDRLNPGEEVLLGLNISNHSEISDDTLIFNIQLQGPSVNYEVPVPVLLRVSRQEIRSAEQIQVVESRPKKIISTGNRKALVVGNSGYSSNPLKNPKNDASGMAQKLTELGFDVALHLDTDRKSMREAIRKFGDELRSSNGVGLFYFAGHGLQYEGENFLVPVDADIQNDYEIRDECISAGMVLRMMELYENPMNIIILDACRNNPYSRSFRDSSNGLAPLNVAPVGSIISYATAPGKVAYDGEGNHGLYTQALLDAMSMPGLSIEQVFKNVRVRVAEKSNKQQIPWTNSSLLGEFSFLEN